MRLLELTGQVKAPTTARSQQFINDLVMDSELLQNLNNFSLGATEGQYRPSDGAQALLSRAKGGSYNPTDLSPAALISDYLKIHGFILHYDETYETDHDLGIGIDMEQWLRDELQNRSIDTSEAIESLIIAGDGVGDNMKGIATILDGVTDIPGLGITGVIDAAATIAGDSLDIGNEANYELFEELFELWRAEVKGVDMIICNRSAAARLKTIGRANNAYNTELNSYGNRLETIDGIPLIRVDDTVIGKTEPDNNVATDTTSIYLCKNRVGYWDIKSNSGLAIWEPGELQEEKMSRALKFEVRGRNQIRHRYAIRRVRNLKL